MGMQEKADQILTVCREQLEQEWIEAATQFMEPVAVLTEMEPQGDEPPFILEIGELDVIADDLAEASSGAAAELRRMGYTPGLVTLVIAMTEGLTVRHIPAP